MTIQIHPERPLGVTTVAGGWAANTIVLKGILKQIIVHPTTQSTMYDFSLKNDKNILIYERTSTSGSLIEEVEIPLGGIYTMRISNATRNEAFEVVLNVQTS